MNAIQIGRTQAIKSSLIGLVTAYLLMAGILMGDSLMDALLWIRMVDFWPNLLVGLAGLFLSAYVFGGWAGKEIIEKGRNHYFVGIKYGLIILFFGSLFGNTVGFVTEGLSELGQGSPIIDYYVKPLYWIFIFGLIPTIIIGCFFGRRIWKLSQE